MSEQPTTTPNDTKTEKPKKLPRPPKPKSRRAHVGRRCVTETGNRRVGERVRGSGRSLVEIAAALMQSPVFRAVAAAMPVKAGRGRTPQYPPVIVLLYAALCRFLGSSSGLDAELRNSATWEQIREHARTHLDLELRAEPIQYEHFLRYRTRYLSEPVLHALADVFRSASIGLAKSLGCFQPHGSDHDWLNPQLGNCIYGDGTVLAPWSDVHEGLVCDPTTGEIYTAPIGSGAKNIGNARIAEGVAPNYKGHGPTKGRLYIGIRAMSPIYRCGIVLDVRPVRDHNEMATATPALQELANLLPDAVDAFIWDGGAAADTHRTLLAHGIPLLNPPPRDAKPGVKRNKNRRLQRHESNPKVLVLDPVVHLRDGERCQHEFAIGDGGALHQGHRGFDGSITLGTRLTAQKLDRRRSEDGVYRWTLRHAIVCGHDYLDIDVDPAGTAPSQSRTNRGRLQISNVLRVIPDIDDLFADLYGARSDIEGFWGWHKRNLNWKRSHSHRPDAEFFELLASAVLASGQVWYEHLHLHEAQLAA